MNPISRILKKVPGVRNFIGPDGALSDGSHRFVMRAMHGDPHAIVESSGKTGTIIPLKPIDPMSVNLLHRKPGYLIITSGSDMHLQNDRGQLIKVSGNIKRSDLRVNPKLAFLFGDSVEDNGKPLDQRIGKGGQAAEMAGEPNAVGIPILWKAPNGTDEFAYFSDTKILDEKLAEIKGIIDKAFAQINPGSKVVVPVDEKGEINLGTGIAQLSTRAPSLLRYIESKIRELKGQAQTATNVKPETPAPQVSRPTGVLQAA
jgi:hypothetical protein